MRRPVPLLLAGALLLLPTACGTDPYASSRPSVAPTATVAAGTKTACEAVGQAYTKGMGPFAEAVAKAAGSGSAADRKTAQQKLTDLATSIRTATAGAQDPQIVADGKQAADQLQEKAKDAKVFAGLKTPQDASRLLGPTLQEWLTPIRRHCS